MKRGRDLPLPKSWVDSKLSRQSPLEIGDQSLAVIVQGRLIVTVLLE